MSGAASSNAERVHGWHDFYMLLGTASAALVANNIKGLTAISPAPYVAYVALCFQVISMGVNERRRLHATYSRHSAVSFHIVHKWPLAVDNRDNRGGFVNELGGSIQHAHNACYAFHGQRTDSERCQKSR